MTLQLDPVIWLETPKGVGYAVLMTDYGIDHDRLWTVVIRETGEIWDFRNPDVRAIENITLGVNVRRAGQAE